ncbi:hypothetical protein ACA910_006239 [Epithemia clementina (nom. ined.)]
MNTTAPMVPNAPGPTSGGNNRDPGKRVDNPNPIATLQAAFTQANVRIAQLKDYAPTTTDPATNTTVPICLSYHLCGSCYSNCQRSSTHRALSSGERRRMATFATQHLPAAIPSPVAAAEVASS